MPNGASAGVRAAYARRFPVLPASTPANEPGANNGDAVMVEIVVDGQWTDITPLVMTRATTPITITYGQSDETSAVVPATCNFLLNNRDGRFSPRNAMSPLYGKIGRNTPCRVSVPLGFGKSYRFWGEIPAWPASWDTTGRDIWVAIGAAGPLRRFNQNNTPLRSTLYQALAALQAQVSTSGISGYSPVPTVAYWSLEDQSAATSMASGIGGPPMTISGTPTLAASTPFSCSAALPEMGAGTFAGIVPPYTRTFITQIRMLISFPAASGIPNGSPLWSAYFSGGNAQWGELYYGTGGTIGFRAFDTGGNKIVDSGSIAFAVDGENARVGVDITDLGVSTQIVLSTVVIKNNTTVGAIETTTTLAVSMGNVTQILITPNKDQSNTVFGHVSVQNISTSVFDVESALLAFVGEAADVRIARLLLQAGFQCTIIGTYGSGVAMGPQLPGTIPSLVADAVAADGGFLQEFTDGLVIGYHTRSAFYQRDPSGWGAYFLVLDYAQYQLAGVPVPVDDDRYTINDATITRTNGGSSRSVVSTGTLSNQPPPMGVGSYADSLTLNVETDAQTADQAGWRTYVGTVDRPRYPAITVNLAHPSFYLGGNLGVRSQVLVMGPGMRLAIDNLPAQTGAAPGESSSMIVIGGSESIDQNQHVLSWPCMPSQAYDQVGYCDDGYARADADGSTLTDGVGPADTAVRVSTTTVGSPLWTTGASDWPFDVSVGGEQITVRAVGLVLNPNPWFDVNAAGWAPSGCTLLLTTAHGVPVPQAVQTLEMEPDGVSSTGGVTDVLSGVGTVTAGASYVVGGWAYSASGWSDIRTCIDWYDNTGTYLSTGGLGSVPALPSNAWTYLSQTLIAPAGASQLATRVRYGSTPATGNTFYVWGVTSIPLATQASSPQTFTVVRSVNGIVKSHQPGDAVALNAPTYTQLM